MLAALRRPELAVSGLLAVGVHGLLFGLLIAGVSWKRTPPPKLIVELWQELPQVTASRAPASVQTPPEPQPRPAPAPVPVEAPKPVPKRVPIVMFLNQCIASSPGWIVVAGESRTKRKDSIGARYGHTLPRLRQMPRLVRAQGSVRTCRKRAAALGG